jgi:hypothetical protein
MLALWRCWRVDDVALWTMLALWTMGHADRLGASRPMN